MAFVSANAPLKQSSYASVGSRFGTDRAIRRLVYLRRQDGKRRLDENGIRGSTSLRCSNSFLQVIKLPKLEGFLGEEIGVTLVVPAKLNLVLYGASNRLKLYLVVLCGWQMEQVSSIVLLSVDEMTEEILVGSLEAFLPLHFVTIGNCPGFWGFGVSS